MPERQLSQGQAWSTKRRSTCLSPNPRNMVEAGTLKAWKLLNRYEKKPKYSLYPCLRPGTEDSEPWCLSSCWKRVLWKQIHFSPQRPATLQTDRPHPEPVPALAWPRLHSLKPFFLKPHCGLLHTKFHSDSFQLGHLMRTASFLSGRLMLCNMTRAGLSLHTV